MEKQIIKGNYQSLIFEFRGYKVMIDVDLAILYGVPTGTLKQQIKRNSQRFPIDFMFELTKEEKELLVKNFERFKNLKFTKNNPLVFTEQGVAMLSSVLRSEKAIKINIEIMRAFAKYRALLRENDELRKEIKGLDQKLNQAFKYLLDRIDELHQKKNEPRKQIGFKIGGKKE